MAGSHGRELWFDTDLGDEYKLLLKKLFRSFFFLISKDIQMYRCYFSIKERKTAGAGITTITTIHFDTP